MEQHNLVIIGSGPAGYTAAIYAARADLKPIMYVGLQPGGQLTTTTEVDNFPGYPQGVDGNQLMEDLKNQAERFGTDVRWGMITSVEFSDTPGGFHTLTVDESTQIQAQSVIIATGATAKYLGLPSEEKFMGHGVSACAVCDGFFYKGQNVVVVGRRRHGSRRGFVPRQAVPQGDDAGAQGRASCVQSHAKPHHVHPEH